MNNQINIIIMKQKIYIFGLITTLVVFTGTIFKVNHFPGAGIMLTLGLTTLVLFFIPVALINHYKSEESSHNILLYFVTWLTCFVMFTAMLFKLQHWPGAGIMLTIAIPFPYVIFLPIFLTVTSRNKNFNIYNTVFVLLLLALNSVFAALLALNVSKDRIDDSYDLSENYNRLEKVLIQLPDSYPQSTVDLKIDEVLKIINECQILILQDAGLTLEQWSSNPDNLKNPTARGVGFEALAMDSDLPPAYALLKGLNSLIDEMENTPGYEIFAKNSTVIADYRTRMETETEWVNRMILDTNLAWSLIFLDGLKTDLLLIKASL